MRKLFVLMALAAAGVQAQTTNLWIGPTNVAAIGSWTNAANWSPDIPDTITEVANFTADFTVNATVTLDGTQTVNGVIFNDVSNSPTARQSFTINAGSPAGVLLFGGTSPFVNVNNAVEALPLAITPPTDYASFTKLGGGWLRLTTLMSNDLPPALSVPAGALMLDQNGSNLVVTASGFVKSGGGQFVLQSTMTLMGSGNITVNEGRIEVRNGSTNFTGNIIVNSNGQYVARFSPYSNQFGDTNGSVTVNATGQAKFQDPVAFTNGEAWNLNGFRTDGSLQMDYADATLTGPINITTNSHININTFANSIRHSRLLGLISDGVSSGGVTFTIGYGGGSSGGADTQYTNLFSASRFILSASNSYKGATYISVRTGTTNVANQVLVVELTNGNNRLPATTPLTLGGAPPGITANGGASATLLLDGVSQDLGGLATLGTGIFNRVSSTTPDLCAITINTASGSVYSFNGVIGGTNANDSNISITKKGLGTEVFGGANTYTGQTVVVAGFLEASNSFALGTISANTSVSNGAQLRVSGNCVIGDELILAGGGGLAGSLGVVRSINGTNTLNGPVSFIGGVDGRIQTAGAGIIFNGGVTSANLNVMFATAAGTTTTINTNPVKIGAAIFRAHDPGTLYLNTSGNIMGTFNPAWGDTVFIGASNALPTNVVLLIGQPGSYTAGSCVLDLNGYDVSCGQLWSTNLVPTNAQPYNLIIRNSNAAPATLIVNQATNSLYEGLLVGNLSLLKSGGGTLTLNGTNTFAGATTISNGTLSISAGGSLACSTIVVCAAATLTATGRYDGTLTLVTNQTLSGIGRVNGIVTNGGAVSPGMSAGTLTISNYMQTSAGTLNIELGGTNAPDHDLLAAGSAALGGTLNVALISGYAPASGDSIPIVTASVGLTGTFATVSFPSITSGLGWSIAYSSAAAVLSVTGSSANGYDLYSQQITNAALRAPEADADADGYANLLEYATGGNPTNIDARSRMSSAQTNNNFAIQFSRDTNAVDVTLTVEGGYATTNDATWTGIAVNSNGTWNVPAIVNETGASPVTVTVQDTASAATNRFLRLRVTRP